MGLGPKRTARRLYWRYLAPGLHRAFYNDLVTHTDDFRRVTWLGYPVWQSVTDLSTIPQTTAEVRPELLIETGTHRGGSSLFYAHLLTSWDGAA